jgi:hypothetical protein
MDWIVASARMAGTAERPRRGRRYIAGVAAFRRRARRLLRRLAVETPANPQSVHIAACGASSAASRQADPYVLSFLVALAGWRSWNFRQAPARVNLLVGRTLGWRRAISHRNLPRTFQPGFRGLAGNGIRRLFWLARLLARHRSHSFNHMVAAVARARQSYGAAWSSSGPRTAAPRIFVGRARRRALVPLMIE